MIFVSDIEGTIRAIAPSSIYQGSTGVNDVILLAPFDACCVVSPSFCLPNGQLITPGLSDNVSQEDGDGYVMKLLDDFAGIFTDKSGTYYNAWRLVLDYPLTQMSGDLSIQFIISKPDGTRQSTSSTLLPIGAGNPYIEPSFTEADWNAITTALTKVDQWSENAKDAADVAEEAKESAAASASQSADSASAASNSAEAAATSEQNAGAFASCAAEDAQSASESAITAKDAVISTNNSVTEAKNVVSAGIAEINDKIGNVGDIGKALDAIASIQDALLLGGSGSSNEGGGPNEGGTVPKLYRHDIRIHSQSDSYVHDIYFSIYNTDPTDYSKHCELDGDGIIIEGTELNATDFAFIPTHYITATGYSDDGDWGDYLPVCAIIARDNDFIIERLTCENLGAPTDSIFAEYTRIEDIEDDVTEVF